MAGSESGPEIEEILDCKKRYNKIRYLIKWEGYDSDDNTWETKDDLIVDGFKDVVERYNKKHKIDPEAMMGKKKKKVGRPRSVKKKAAPEPKKAPAKKKDVPVKSSGRGRSRSKTPNPGTRNRSAPTEAKSPTEDTPASKVDEEFVPPEDGYDSMVFPDNFWLSWIVVFVLSIVLTIVVGVANTTIKGPKPYLSVAQMSAVLPSLFCVFAILVRGVSSSYANRACALNMWLGLVSFFEVLPEATKGFGAFEFEKDADSFVWFALGMWQLMVVLTVLAKQEDANVLPLSAYTVAVAACLVYVDTNYIKVEPTIWLVVLVAMISVGISFGTLLARETELSKWLEFNGCVFGAAVVVMHVLPAAGYSIGKIEETKLDKLTLKMDSLWFSEQLMRWVVSCTFTYNALTDRED